MPAPKRFAFLTKFKPVTQPVAGVRIATIFLLLALGTLACRMVDRAAELQATESAVSSVQTALAATSMVLGTLPVITPVPGGGSTSAPTATVFDAGPAATEPSDTAVPADPPTALLVEVDERLMKSARILLFEDMSASRQIRLVKEALDRGEYFYLDVGSAKGWFKTQLLSGRKWDLVIASGEADRDFGGEFFEYIDQHVAGGGSAVIETWDLDSAPTGRVRSLLNRCGLTVQSDWFEPNLRVFFWTDPTHPIFNRPNSLPNGLRNARALWHGDIGDLLALEPGNADRGRILASTNPDRTTTHGLIADCLDGRLLLQTFRSHEYHHDDMVALWQNYVDYVLRGYFRHSGRPAPPAAPTAISPLQPTPTTVHPPTPGPDYSLPATCGSLLSVRLLKAPQFQPDLFEHHAAGTFLILRIEVQNVSQTAIQIWDGDYSIEAQLRKDAVSYPLNQAASGYLFIEQPAELYQHLVLPGETFQTSVAFDVDPAAEAWEFVLRPGIEFDPAACEARIPLAH